MLFGERGQLRHLGFARDTVGPKEIDDHDAPVAGRRARTHVVAEDEVVPGQRRQRQGRRGAALFRSGRTEEEKGRRHKRCSRFAEVLSDTLLSLIHATDSPSIQEPIASAESARRISRVVCWFS